ncbi:Hypothetical protein BQ3484_262 [Cedratvirus A11]|uniref:Uncharacterized protein n=1 Tax=Cedratvirus A11 TaxID=1903266 RepID=A0A1M7XUS5_9VIRU|nr:Hypothetical protein BQ3484_262 [Cedratvirus A11]SHO33330.1 Hypothetical protein BQ3484_262 [Cedratvirus A11]
MLSTPYYATIVSVSATKCTNETERTFTPYTNFCLLTQIGTWLAKKGKRGEVTCITVEEEGRMALKVKTFLTREEDILEAQEKLNQIVSERPTFCLIYSSLLQNAYPAFWVREMLPFVDVVSPLFNPFVLDDDLYLDLSQEPNYFETYDNTLLDIKQLLHERWSTGCVTFASSIANDWSLAPLDDDDLLYQATWNDDRFAKDLVPFLLSRLSGSRELRIKIRPSLPMMHNVASVLSDTERSYYFIMDEEKKMLDPSAYLITFVDNLDEAHEVTNLVEEAAFSSIGECFTEKFASVAEAEKKAEGLSSFVIYRNLGSPQPYVLSTLQGFNLPSPLK